LRRAVLGGQWAAVPPTAAAQPFESFEWLLRSVAGRDIFLNEQLERGVYT